MAQLVSVYYGSDGVTTFDGANYQFFKMPEFLKLTTTYADVLAYADTIANAVATHDAVVVAAEQHNANAERVAAVNFKKFFEISINSIYEVVAGSINDKVAGGLRALSVPERNIKYHCVKCNVVSPGPNGTRLQGMTNFTMVKCGHEVEQVKQILYALHKTLTETRPS